MTERVSLMPTSDQNHIQLETALPGEKSKQLRELRDKHVPRGPFNTSQVQKGLLSRMWMEIN
jgi:hypothetical protein